MHVGITKEQYMEAGGRGEYPPDENGWREFKDKFLAHIPDNYRKTGDNRITFMLSSIDRAVSIKKAD